jgi:capsid protein
MSQLITQAFVQQFKGNVVMLYQQRDSKLAGTVREEGITGDAHYFERLGPTEMVEKLVRHADTQYVDSQHSRRKLTIRDFEWADLVDKQDKIRLLISPESEYAQNAANAMRRNYDRLVIEAFTADAASGPAGATAVTFTSEALFDTDISAAAADSDDIRAAKAAFDNADIDEDDRYALVTPDTIQQLLADTKVISSDFNTLKALAAGGLGDQTWMGFKWKVSTLCPTVAGDTDRYIFFWHKSAMGIAVGAEPTVRIDELPTKSYAVQVYASRTMGATRVQGGVGRFRVKVGG